MWNRILWLSLTLFCSIFGCFAQNCALDIHGTVIDEGSGMPLSDVNVIIREVSRGEHTDLNGDFHLDGVCEGSYHLLFSHIGCEPVEVLLELSSDTSLYIFLSHTSTSLEGVVIAGKKNSNGEQASLSINRRSIEDNSNQNLSQLLENETGVHLLKNGAGISKPVIQGLFGNRLTILNNGIIQSGQQWGNDHSPEIDPFSADKITVVKGTNAIEFGANLGSVILVEPMKIGSHAHLHGQIKYVYETNGRGHIINSRLEKKSKLFAWRINGTLRKYGDRKTPDYFLNNTGIQEGNLSLQIQKSWNEKLFFDFYLSTFNTRLGVLRGSHVGNLTDLEAAFGRSQPFFTDSVFSYHLDAPKQHVSHHLAKMSGKYFVDENQFVEFVAAFQNNIRKEFDVRRANRSTIPALSLNQYTLNTELKYSNEFDNGLTWKSGVQTIITDNTNDPKTGILPLIPDYAKFNTGIFSRLSKELEPIDVHLGLRYDFENQNALTISSSLPRTILQYKRDFHNVGAALALKFKLTKVQTLTLNSGYATRNPAINELYSGGLHQGVSGIEEGDVDLGTEKSIKSTIEHKWIPSAKFSFNTLMYFQHFKDYIFLNPQEELRLTIRGAFPVFRYEQNDANIYGMDISTQFTLGKSFFGLINYSYIRGNNLDQNIPLINIPPNALYGSMTFWYDKLIKVNRSLTLEELEFTIDDRFVSNQSNLLASQDFLAPPPSYNLVGAKLATNVVLSKYNFRFTAAVTNIFNVRYRDYLNRQRYFADELGRSIQMGLKLKF